MDARHLVSVATKLTHAESLLVREYIDSLLKSNPRATVVFKELSTLTWENGPLFGSACRLEFPRISSLDSVVIETFFGNGEVCFPGIKKLEEVSWDRLLKAALRGPFFPEAPKPSVELPNLQPCSIAVLGKVRKIFSVVKVNLDVPVEVHDEVYRYTRLSGRPQCDNLNFTSGSRGEWDARLVSDVQVRPSFVPSGGSRQDDTLSYFFGFWGLVVLFVVLSAFSLRLLLTTPYEGSASSRTDEEWWYEEGYDYP